MHPSNDTLKNRRVWAEGEDATRPATQASEARLGTQVS
ncbi:hypothetical protein RISK_006588 [Rhodopirellula islandica]|uniref:Uncharacterized protein n=1 Tax=Rhodopirellula islandica TaxID=595434 RepID=A0A0J1B3U9_RHOIS|nr:hypothetical protein RISK_006588 [Rhodopirellula islandica]